MLRSMYSGISGLKNFQTKLDVVGNNIANVNTFGYKKGRVTFKDLVNQSVGSASGAGGGVGGTNPKQVGLGASMSTVDNVYNQGALQNTGRTLDVGISGEGFFQVMTADGVRYTRSGNFYTDVQGNIVTGDGNYLIGLSAPLPNPTPTTVPAPGALTGNSYDAQGKIDSTKTQPTGYIQLKIPTGAQNLSIGKDGLVTFVDATGGLQRVGYVSMANFANPGGLEKSGVNLFSASQNSGGAALGSPSTNGLGQLTSGTLEMSNVDLSEEFTEMIIAQRGFQANTRIITTSDQVLEELVNLKR
ncbi:flagellar basal-body rod protein FlgG [Exiguobacterium indicum]|uniref:Flagellar hook protein FlgE n=1 Tax=Exiguobacterium indicum TaxID=296995 RepID=A0A0V8GK47_9BACL|nr:flagellar basal body rod protein FlgG [Exiguobacterium enclense]KSU50644.1 flagellar basal-body rod protein FlgG [Exiguobacterium enclense]SDC01091.1 flagellar hook protein FlgE [Exiguobacterium enclense]